MGAKDSKNINLPYSSTSAASQEAFVESEEEEEDMAARVQLIEMRNHVSELYTAYQSTTTTDDFGGILNQIEDLNSKAAHLQADFQSTLSQRRRSKLSAMEKKEVADMEEKLNVVL